MMMMREKAYDLDGAAADSAVGVSVGVGRTEVIVTIPPLLVAMTGFIVVDGMTGANVGVVVIVGVEVVGTTTVTIGVDADRVGTATGGAVVRAGGGTAGVATGGAADVGGTADVTAGGRGGGAGAMIVAVGRGEGAAGGGCAGGAGLCTS